MSYSHREPKNSKIGIYSRHSLQESAPASDVLCIEKLGRRISQSRGDSEIIRAFLSNYCTPGVANTVNHVRGVAFLVSIAGGANAKPGVERMSRTLDNTLPSIGT